MRIHSLELEAYGPFPQKVAIDFEELNEAGIFLLNGPTGSGKSSILDAICFALYGTTSTNRPDLRSHFAADNVEPYVQLEFTVQSQRYRVRRSPSWLRRKKQKVNEGGNSHRTINATADLDVFNPVTGQWENKVDGAKNVSLEMTNIMGLTKEQFTQVMLLPQGEFAKFLLSNSTDRETLLKKLFRTTEYQQIQDALKVMAEDAQQKVAAQEQVLETLQRDATGAIERAQLPLLPQLQQELLHEQFGEEIPANLLPELVKDEIEEQEAEDFTALVETRLEYLAASLHSNQKILEASQQEYENRVAARDSFEQLVKNWQIHEQLLADQEELEEQKDKITQLGQALEKAREAQQVVHPGRLLTDAQRTTASAETRFTQCWESYLQSLETLDSNASEATLEAELLQVPHQEEEALKTYRQLVESALRNLEEYLETETEAQRAEQKVLDLATKLEALEQKRAQAEEDEEALRTRIIEEKEFLDLHTGIGELRISAEHAVEGAKKQVVEAQKLERIQGKIKTYRVELEKAEAEREEATARVEELYKLRYRQATFILAQELEDGAPCPVCGAVEHPAPAQISDTSTTVEDRHIGQAQKARGEAEEKAQKALLAFEKQQQEMMVLQETGVLPLAEAHAQLKQSEENLATRRGLEQAYEQSKKQLAQLQEELETHRQAVQSNQATTVQTQTLHAAALEEHKRLAASLAQAATGLSFDQRYQAVRGVLKKIEEVELHFTRLVSARAHQQNAQNQFDTALSASSFESLADAQRAAVDPETYQQTQEKINLYVAAVTKNSTQLAEEAQEDIAQRLSRGEAQPDANDLGLYQEKVNSIAEKNLALTRAQGYLEQSQKTLALTLETYQTTLADAQEAILDAQRKNHLAETAHGLGKDNTLKMTLTTFVLATQLAEIATAASQHLERMTHGRYLLKHSDAKQGNSKSGLNILIHDSWHSKDREAATLSGGETFMASLSLALGLADVVQQRAGGIDIATLFVDEGFGTLDEGTLEEVMSTLDSLREHGRVIGLISHVTEMKNRIPQQILLTTSPEGSRLVSGTNTPDHSMGTPS